MKDFLIRKIKVGALFAIPLMLTTWVTDSAVKFVDGTVGAFIPEDWRIGLLETLTSFWGFGVLAATIMLFVLGMIFDGRIQQTIYNWIMDKTVRKVPGMSVVHDSAKQILEALTSDDSPFQYPKLCKRWSGNQYGYEIVFDLGETSIVPDLESGDFFISESGKVIPRPKEGMRSVLAPQAVNPSNTYLGFEHEDDLIDISHIPVETVVKMLISAGVTPATLEKAHKLGEFHKHEEEIQAALGEWKATQEGTKENQRSMMKDVAHSIMNS